MKRTPTSRGTTRREIYYRFESDATGPIVSRSWAVETEPPYRAGNGLRLRLGSRAFHVGTASPTAEDDPRRVVGKADVEATPEEIGKWVNGALEEA